jgi:hypothetical protein
MIGMGAGAAAPMMEHPENTISVPPLVDDRVLLRFCKAVQSYADSVGSHDEAAQKLRALRARLDNLRGLASLSRLAIVGHPLSPARVVDEMYCLSVDFPSDPLECPGAVHELYEDEPDKRVLLAAAVDLFAGASFVSKDKPEQRNRFIVGVVRAIEDAIAFPVAFTAEAATYIGEGDGTLSPTHAKIVIANAAQRLLEGDQTCIPLAPAEIRRCLECLAFEWMCKNPVDEFFAAIAGPRLRRIVHWEDPARDRPDDARVGDRVTLLVGDRGEAKVDSRGEACGGDDLTSLGVMFSPHSPAPVVRVVDDGLQVLVPEGARTGPIAIVKKEPDFKGVQSLIAEYAARYPVAWSLSVFANVRMDVWAYPVAFGPRILEILRTPDQRKPDKPSNPA